MNAKAFYGTVPTVFFWFLFSLQVFDIAVRNITKKNENRLKLTENLTFQAAQNLKSLEVL